MLIYLGGFIYVEKIDVESKIGIVADKNRHKYMKALFVEIQWHLNNLRSKNNVDNNIFDNNIFDINIFDIN